VEKPPAPISRYAELWAIFGPATLVTLVGFLLAWQFVGDPPPEKIVIASGASWGAYYRYAQVYAEHLKKHGIEVEVLETRGSFNNLEMVGSGKADVGFVQGGLKLERNEVFESLGSIYREPLWVFVRAPEPPEFLTDLKGKRLAVGGMGSGTRVVALQVLDDNKMVDQVTLIDFGGEMGEELLKEGEVDALFLVGSPEIPMVSRLLAEPGITLMNWERADGYAVHHREFSSVILPRGSIDLAADLPTQDTRLVGPAATLVVRKDFHDALVAVFLETAEEIHQDGGALEKSGEFPSRLYGTFQLHQDAKRFYARGVPFFYRHLPFHWASAADRLLILLLPFLTLLIPIVKLLPPFYGWTMKRKIYNHYKAISKVERRLGRDDPQKLLKDLEKIDTEVHNLYALPAAFAAPAHSLRIHLKHVRNRIKTFADLDLEE
jgi:TRAP transporter TAXI family solute receptor